MTRALRRATRRAAAVTLLGAGVLAFSAPAAQAAPGVTPGFVVFVAKDQAGGAYWLTTTTAVAGATTAAATGEQALLTVNEQVLLPAQGLLPG